MSRLKNAISLILLSFFAFACTSIHSVVDTANVGKYSNYLIVMTYEDGIVKKFVTRLNEAFENQFAKSNTPLKTILYRTEFDKLKLNEYEGLQKEMKDKVAAENIDLVILFKPQTFYNTYGRISDADYIVVAVDPKTNKEVWKSKFEFKSVLGNPYKSSAEKFYKKLESDKIIN